MTLLAWFEWLETSPVGAFVKDKGATFATIEAIHLMALAVLGGAVLATDLRLLNVAFRDIPSNVIAAGTHRWFKVALAVLLITGFFMLAGVATKCYHNYFYRVKMIALGLGILFVFVIRQPILKRPHDSLQPVTLKLLGAASISVWFIVAASGRWIGFS